MQQARYLGNQHVFHQGVPRLVKQWRKSDFANTVFTVSVQVNAGSDGTNWPLIINVPGEGYGDDSLQNLYNHKKLTDADTGIFFIEKNYTASGGKCTQLSSSGTAPQGGGIPTSLMISDSSWRQVQWTGSPVWKAPAPVPTLVDRCTQHCEIVTQLCEL
jgi:hypothetical protein